MRGVTGRVKFTQEEEVPYACPFSERIEALEARVDAVEKDNAQIGELIATMEKIARYIKLGLPAVASAAVTSGIVSGKWGAFFKALFM